MEQQTTGLSSSRVIVEYLDPSGAFPSIAQDLRQHLPLRDLNWKPETRPIRSIPTLHIEFVENASAVTKTSSAPPPRGGGSDDAPGVAGQIVSKGNNVTGQLPELQKERRHQIPGLRPTPFLKVYFLRCSDTETYKSVHRKLLKEWVAENAQSEKGKASRSKQENHNASEWLIILVTDSSSNRQSSQAASNSRRESKLFTKGSKGLVDKLRSDFNGSSKSSPDRVAQLILSDTSAENARPNTTPVQPDRERHWEDLTLKLKSLILASFDLRVSQYEEDIKEKDSQRSLPGWNFNTFFLLKEGLALGFESVGLLEDALNGYRELGVGLNEFVGLQDGKAPDSSTEGHFRNYSKDLGRLLHGPGSQPSGSDTSSDSESSTYQHSDGDLGADVLDTSAKPYRDMILANDISLFDFQCYIFAREISLLFSMANVVLQLSSTDGNNANARGQKQHGGHARRFSQSRPEDTRTLAEICQFTLAFVGSGVSSMRGELLVVKEVNVNGEEPESISLTKDNQVNRLVSSWAFSVCQCVLEATLLADLDAQLQPIYRNFTSNSSGKRPATSPSNGQGQGTPKSKYPDRRSSLPQRSPGRRPPSPEKFPSVTSLDALRLLPPTTAHNRCQRLAAARADLLSFQRRVLSDLALTNAGWKCGRAALDEQSAQINGSGNSSEDEDASEPVPMKSTGKLIGVCNSTLSQALAQAQAFRSIFEDLTISSLAHYVVGHQKTSAEAMTADIAAIRFNEADYSTAAAYFRLLGPFYAKDRWSQLELVMFDMYAKCLERLKRNEEYVQVGLKIVAVLARMRKSRSNHETPILSKIVSEGYLTKAITNSAGLREPVVLALTDVFGNVALSPYIKHENHKDSFYIKLVIDHVLQEELQADEVRCKLVGDHPDNRAELWLSAQSVVFQPQSRVVIYVESSKMVPGWFLVDEIQLSVGQIILVHRLLNQDESKLTLHHKNNDFSSQSSPYRLLLWSQPEALNVELSKSPAIDLSKRRSLTFKITSGWNDISKGNMIAKSGSAGLRLHIFEANFYGPSAKMSKIKEPGVIEFSSLGPHEVLQVEIPYSLENDLNEISIKIEVEYTTANGFFTFATPIKTNVTLALGINVQDNFQKDFLISKFTMGTATTTPVRIKNCKVQGTEDFIVMSLPLPPRTDVFPKHPASFMCKIRRKSHGDNTARKHASQRGLKLCIHYTCISEEIEQIITKVFMNSIAKSPFSQLARLLIRPILDFIQISINTEALEQIGVSRKFNIPAILDDALMEVLKGLPPKRYQSLLRWLRAWQEEHLVIALPPEADESLIRQLTVPSAIPEIDVVHTASVGIQQEYLKHAARDQYVVVGQPLPAVLRLSHTRQWGGSQALEKELRFCCDLQSDQDTWLIGGTRRCHFGAKEGEVLTFSLLLFPQRSGNLLLPSVKIWPLSVESTEQAPTQRRSEPRPLVCETDNTTETKTILVIPNLGSTTMGLDTGDSESAAWLVESTPRNGLFGPGGGSDR